METIIMNTENSKTCELHKFVIILSQRLDLKNWNKHLALENVPIYWCLKNIRQLYKNNKLKIIDPTWNDEFQLPQGSYSLLDIQDYIDYIIKKHETLSPNPPIHICISRINNRLVIKTKDEYKQTMKLFGSTKKLIDKTKDVEIVPSLKVVEVVSVKFNLVDNKY